MRKLLGSTWEPETTTATPTGFSRVATGTPGGGTNTMTSAGAANIADTKDSTKDINLAFNQRCKCKARKVIPEKARSEPYKVNTAQNTLHLYFEKNPLKSIFETFLSPSQKYGTTLLTKFLTQTLRNNMILK